MFSNGWIWIFIAFFFIWGPFKWARRGRWGRWDRWHWEEGDRSARSREPKPSAEDLERQARRDEQVEQLEARVNELESRLDFAERLLAPRRDAAMVPPSGAA